MSLGAIKGCANGILTGTSGHELREQNTEHNWLRLLTFTYISLFSWVNILKAGNTIPNSIHSSITKSDQGLGICCCFSKNQFLLEEGFVVLGVLSFHLACFGVLSSMFG